MHLPCFSSAPRRTIDEKDWMKPKTEGCVAARVRWWNSKTAGDALSLQTTPPEKYVRSNKFKDLHSFGRKTVESGDDDEEPKGCFGFFAGHKKPAPPKQPLIRNFTLKYSSIYDREQRLARIHAAKQRNNFNTPSTPKKTRSHTRADAVEESASLADQSFIDEHIHLAGVVRIGSVKARRLRMSQRAATPGAAQFNFSIARKPVRVDPPSPASSTVPSIYEITDAGDRRVQASKPKWAVGSAGSESSVPVQPSTKTAIRQSTAYSAGEHVETGQEAVSQRPLSWNMNNRKRPRPNKANKSIHSGSSSGTSSSSSASCLDSESSRSSSPPSTVATESTPKVVQTRQIPSTLTCTPSPPSPAYVSDDKGNIERIASIRRETAMDTTNPKTGLPHPKPLIPVNGTGLPPPPKSTVTRRPVSSVAECTPETPLWQKPANPGFSKYTAYNPAFKSFAKSIGEHHLYQIPGESASEAATHRTEAAIDAEMPDFDSKPNAAAIKHLAEIESGVMSAGVPFAGPQRRHLRSAQRPANLQRPSAITKSSAASSPRSTASKSPRTPLPTRMTSNRYPVHSSQSAKNFSTEPMYTPRGQDKGEAWDQKRKEDAALKEKERKEEAKAALKDAKAHTQAHAGKDCADCETCKGARLGKNYLII